jgi:hypothetical protein
MPVIDHPEASRSTAAGRAGVARPRSAHAALALLASLLVAAGLVACQGDFSRPALDNPNDPASGQLPPTPTVTASAVCEEDSILETVTVEVPPPDPGTYELVTVTASRLVRATIAWSISSEVGITEYQVFRATSEAEAPGTLILHAPPGVGSIVDSVDLDTIAYDYRVRSVDDDGRLSLLSEPAAVRCRAVGDTLRFTKIADPTLTPPAARHR